MCAKAMEFYDAKTIPFFVFAILQTPVTNILRDSYNAYLQEFQYVWARWVTPLHQMSLTN